MSRIVSQNFAKIARARSVLRVSHPGKTIRVFRRHRETEQARRAGPTFRRRFVLPAKSGMDRSVYQLLRSSAYPARRTPAVPARPIAIAKRLEPKVIFNVCGWRARTKIRLASRTRLGTNARAPRPPIKCACLSIEIIWAELLRNAACPIRSRFKDLTMHVPQAGIGLLGGQSQGTLQAPLE